MKAYLFTTSLINFPDSKADYGLLKEVFNNKKVEQIRVKELPEEDRAFVVIAGSDNINNEEIINNELLKIKKVVLFITSDECALFNVDKITHNNIEIWIQTPHPKHKQYNKFFLGAPLFLKEDVPVYQEKIFDVFFAGQITHQRRVELAKGIRRIQSLDYNPTRGFMQGDIPKVYYQRMSKSKIVPAPSGNSVIDSFRFYEALEMLCLPIADIKESNGNDFDYWQYIYKDNIPVTKTNNWYEIYKIVEKELENYPNNMHRAVAWWIKYKRDFGYKIMEQLNEH